MDNLKNDLQHENSLLRRERALLIELEKARTRILASIFNTGGGCDAEDVRQVGELLMAIEALHLEASGGVQRPPGVACACVLCRPGGTDWSGVKGRVPVEDEAMVERPMRPAEEVDALMDTLPATHRRWCTVSGACACVGCAVGTVSAAEFAAWAIRHDGGEC